MSLDSFDFRRMAQQARDLAELLPDPLAKAKLQKHACDLEAEAALLDEAKIAAA